MKLEGVIYCGENLEWMRKFPDEFVDLCYIDPPFFSNRYYEVIFHDGQEIRAYEDRWRGGIEHYIQWMRDRVFEIHRILKPTGSFYLHCDHHASHYLKVMCDEIFAIGNFRNEIIWYYKTGGVSKRWFGRKHDVILFYSKSSQHQFYPQKEKSYTRTLPEPHTPSGKRLGVQRDEVCDLCEAGTPGQKYRMVAMRDVWLDLPNLFRNDQESLGYPTQKPEALLERIVKASSQKGDIVFDPFCGCGTTLIVAQRYGRRWLGIDVSPTACKLMKRRLAKEGVTGIQIIGIPYEPEELKELKPFEFQNWVVGIMGGVISDKKSADMGIDGYSFMERDPIQVKQSDKVGRNVVDNFETAMRRAGKTKGYIVAFSFTKGAYNEVARVKRKNGLEIELLTVEELVEKYGK